MKHQQNLHACVHSFIEVCNYTCMYLKDCTYVNMYTDSETDADQPTKTEKADRRLVDRAHKSQTDRHRVNERQTDRQTEG